MFVVAGEALMDVFPSASTATGMTMDARIGGSPLNVAIGLARLGRQVAFFGALSQGPLGDRLAQALADEGVGLACSVRLAAPTTLSLVGLDARGVPDYAFYGEGAADRLLPLSALAQVPAGAEAYQFGSYAMVVEPVAATQRALVEREHARSVVAYDPNIRLNVEPDIQRWRDTVQWMLPRTTLLKISDEDLGLLHPGADPAALARQWLAAGVALVVVTRGAKGAWAWTAQQHVAVPSRPLKLVDTVGAGDTFQAALLTALAERALLSRAGMAGLGAQALSDILGFAAHAAAITCSRRGADLPRRRELPA
ncbi:Fructokinase [Rubrivivax sp. A210]|uniref:carbohydrate kinase family protein n=1 Tax=Rubrivivax sp. A210 TaxID=2772301 RepID=UPI0019186150|nr:carbohydrate kinase [Rubrivivax sp. A210]CAD5372368.1 Fructokinase [Rubrivivax sp. A210]